MTFLQNLKTKECIILAHMEIKGHEAAEKVAKEMDIPGVVTNRLPFTDYFPTIRMDRNYYYK